MKKESPENRAREELDKKFDSIVEQTNYINADIIETNIRNVMSRYDLNITNFWRLRSFFVSKYLAYFKNVVRE